MADLPAVLRQSVDERCDQFEAEWKAGRRPSLAAFLADWTESGADQLFRFLLELDVDYRRKAGETVAIGDYAAEFASFRAIVQEVVYQPGLAETHDLGTGKTRPQVTAVEPQPAGTFGSYELMELLGQGGMGVVYKARQTRLNRLVAIKMLLSGGHASPEEVRRFHAEAEAAAKLDHPNIVPIYEVGEIGGRHFFSMAYIEGPSLAKQLRDEPFTVRAAVEMLRTIADAVQHANMQGIVHRDLKPANILLGLDGRPRVTDFGLAKTLESAAELTTTGQILGTPSYMAPEQAAGQINAISPRTDVYALGAVLYEALVGRPPFRDASVWETIRQVINTEPVSPRMLNPTLPRDLETIVLKALEKQPTARFASAQEFADDLGRFLRDEPILARPVTRTEKCWRWVRKNRTVAMLAAVLLGLVVFIAGGAGVTALVLQSQEQQKTKLAGEKDVLKNQATKLEQQTATLQKESRSERYLSDMIQASDAMQIPTGIGRVREFVDPWADDRKEPDLRGWEWHLLRAAAHEEWNIIQIQTPQGVNVPLSTIAFHPRDEIIAFGGSTGDLFLGPIEDSTKIEVSTEHKQHITNLAWQPSGQRFATSSLDGRVLLWETSPLRKVGEIEIGKIVYAVAWSPNGKLLAATVHEDGVHVFDAETKERKAHLQEQVAEQAAVAFSPRGDLLAVSAHPGGADYQVQLWDTSTWQNLSLSLRDAFVGHQQQVNRICWSRSGQQLLTASFDRTVKLWNVADRRLLHSFAAHDGQVTSAQFARNDREIVSVGWDSAFRRFDIAKEAQTYLGRGHTKRVQWSDLNAKGDLLATVGDDGVVRLWDLQDSATILTRKHVAKSLEDPYSQIAWKRDGRQLAASNNSTTCLWKLDQPEPLASEAGALPAWSERDEHFAIWQYDVLEVRDPSGKVATKTFKSPEAGFGNCRSAWSHRGAKLMISVGSSLFLWEMDSPAPRQFATGLNSLKTLAWSPDDERLLVAGTDGLVTMFRTSDGEKLAAFKPHDLSHAISVAWSPAGEQFITCSPDRTAIVWDATTNKKVFTLAEHSFTVNQAAWSPDGKRIATAGGDSTIRIWTANRGEQSLILRHPDQVMALAWHPDGKRLASLSQDGTLLIHDATRSYEDAADE
jgi:WD40 repeat protein/predicted Ser/Thr protein kinase/cell division protein FtsB